MLYFGNMISSLWNGFISCFNLLALIQKLLYIWQCALLLNKKRKRKIHLESFPFYLPKYLTIASQINKKNLFYVSISSLYFLKSVYYKVNSTIIVPGFGVLGFTGNLHAQKLNKAQKKWAIITGAQYFSAHQQVVVSSTLYFIIYHISSIYPPRNFAPNLPSLPPPPPPTEHDAPSARAGLRFCTTAFPYNRQQGQPKNNDSPRRCQPIRPTTAVP